MASQVMRITLKAYDHQLVDASAKKIIETVKKNGAQVSGPVPLPTKKEVVTILRAVHKYKDSREQFEQRTHKRLIDITTPTQKTSPLHRYIFQHSSLAPKLTQLPPCTLLQFLNLQSISHMAKWHSPGLP